MQATRILASAVGGVLLIDTSISVLKTLVMPGGRIGRLYMAVGGSVDRVFRLAVQRVPDYRRRDRVLAFNAPVVLAVLRRLWAAALLLDFVPVSVERVSESRG